MHDTTQVLPLCSINPVHLPPPAVMHTAAWHLLCRQPQWCQCSAPLHQELAVKTPGYKPCSKLAATSAKQNAVHFIHEAVQLSGRFHY
jgi:hypothetical protein